MRKLLTNFIILPLILVGLMSCNSETTSRSSNLVIEDFSTTWMHLSSTAGDLPVPSASTQQTASLILDIDQNGINDFVIGIRRSPGPSMVWYRRQTEGWTKYLIDDSILDIEAGGASYDIDADGDLDVVMGGDSRSNRIWWWENPYPNFDASTPWTRREIKNSGANKHHDMIFGDFDDDQQSELVFWNQGASALYLAEIPTDPKNTEPWAYTEIYSWSSGDDEEGVEHEGLAKADVDGDGQIDIIGGGRWFKHNGGPSYTANIIDDSQTFTRAAAGQLKEGGQPEVVFVVGDGNGPLRWYEWIGNVWQGHDLLQSNVDHGHSLDIVDINGDGKLDIFVAEMRLDDGNEDAKLWTFLGDGNGNFTEAIVASGYGNHESKVGDLDGDGDLDILGKSYNWQTPRLDVWLNQGCVKRSLDSWERHVIDAAKPWKTVFIDAADIDGDDHIDVITGGWWYKNPGQAGGTWTRHPIGSPLNNMAAVFDFDGDDDIDVLGTEGRSSNSAPNSASFVWAQNDGSGTFQILDNIENGNGDFLQGAVVGRFTGGDTLEVALSWHASGEGVQKLTVPANPAGGLWGHSQFSSTSQDEDLSAADIDRDNDIDLLLGTKWLRNDSASWSVYTINSTGGDPDRNRLADLNGDGRLDAVVGFEAINVPGKLAWYEQPTSATSTWAEHVIANVVGPMSLDVDDMDGDGDPDVVVGEHNLSDPLSAKLYVFENNDGQGLTWTEHIVFTGDEHHDGAQVVDIDNDGDFDIISIGWDHNQVLLYENKSVGCAVAFNSQIWLPIIAKLN